jgi:virginiamycin A acetyltransferase
MRERLKALVRGCALVAVLPRLVIFAFWKRLIGADEALQTATQGLAKVPGLRGQYLRRAFLSRTIAECGPNTVVCWGTVFSRAGARLEDNVYVGANCNLGLVHIERDVLIASSVLVPSGPQTHGTVRIDVPIRDQPGTLSTVHIGRGSWIGCGAIVMADIGANSVVAAGSVVTKPIPADSVAAGVPARVLRSRDGAVGSLGSAGSGGLAQDRPFDSAGSAGLAQGGQGRPVTFCDLIHSQEAGLP